MLTIKHIAPDGVEFISEIDTFEYQPRRDPPPPSLPNCAQVIAGGVSARIGGQQVFCEGQVYVMNDKGKTVGSYNLDLDNGLGQYKPQERFIILEDGPNRFVLVDNESTDRTSQVFTSRALAKQAALALTA